MTIPASDIRPGDYYLGRLVFCVARGQSTRITVACPHGMPIIGQAGKFTFDNDDPVEIVRTPKPRPGMPDVLH